MMNAPPRRYPRSSRSSACHTRPPLQPALGAFLSRDPLPVFNRYGYVDGNPVMRTDPSGNCGQPTNWNDPFDVNCYYSADGLARRFSNGDLTAYQAYFSELIRWNWGDLKGLEALGATTDVLNSGMFAPNANPVVTTIREHPTESIAAAMTALVAIPVVATAGAAAGIGAIGKILTGGAIGAGSGALIGTGVEVVSGMSQGDSFTSALGSVNMEAVGRFASTAMYIGMGFGSTFVGMGPVATGATSNVFAGLGVNQATGQNTTIVNSGIDALTGAFFGGAVALALRGLPSAIATVPRLGGWPKPANLVGQAARLGIRSSVVGVLNVVQGVADRALSGERIDKVFNGDAMAMDFVVAAGVNAFLEGVARVVIRPNPYQVGSPGGYIGRYVRAVEEFISRATPANSNLFGGVVATVQQDSMASQPQAPVNRPVAPGRSVRAGRTITAD